MKPIPFIYSAIACLFAITATAQKKSEKGNQWIHVYRTDNAFTSYPASRIKSLSYDGFDDYGNDQARSLVVSTVDGESVTVPFDAVINWKIGNDVPKVIIRTETESDDVTSKSDYLRGTLEIDGQGIIEDFPPTEMGIRGRGNSTWKPEDGIKLPYRVKFDKKQSLGGLKKAKNYVLLANYYDHSLMRNALAMEIARLLNIKYVNAMIPVDVYFNDKYKGSYNLTEKVGINSGSLHDLDEANSILFELDNMMDEQYCFQSARYGLPVMVKDPDLAPEQFEAWKTDFLEAEALVADGKACEAFDSEDFARYLIMFSLVANEELRHPKSGFIYKTKAPDGAESKYHFGPVWDFDMSFGNIKDNNFTDLMESAEWPIFSNTLEIGAAFFQKMYKQPEMKAACDKVMAEFIATDGPSKILGFFDEYATRIESTSERDITAERVNGWRTYELDKNYISRLRSWVEKRLNYVVSDPNYGICK